MKHQPLICIHGYMVNGGVPKGGIKLKLKGVKLSDNEKESAHSIRLQESALSFFCKVSLAVLRLFVPFCQGVISADIFILVDRLHGIFVDALLDKTGNHLHLLEQLFAFGINCCGV